MKRIFFLIGFFLLVSGAAFASPTPYGPGYGFNTAPDLGRVLTLEELQGKVSYEWFHNRFRTLFARHEELRHLDPAKWAQDAYRLAKSGQFVENSLPVGALIKDVSFTGGNWSANRIWTAAPGQTKAPQGVWDLSMVDSNGVALKIVIAKRCGNLQYIGYDVVAKAPPTPVTSPPPVVREPEIPQREITLRVPPTAYFYGQYRAPASSQTRVFQPRPVAPVSSLPNMRVNNGNNISLSQSQTQSNDQPTRSIRISTFANGGSGYGNADAAASASSSESATAVGAAAGGGNGPGGGGEAAVGTSTSGSSSTSTGTATESGSYGGNTGILIEGEW